ncbi:Histone H1oo [Fukomys damarensis]|uniref:Histone H1oo n=1 Tax=Fukomys damarensis TaxID=885580 RepID=A0A091DVE3_FUKDA|nr:Histone H1oo [Fukomys damarensis]
MITQARARDHRESSGARMFCAAYRQRYISMYLLKQGLAISMLCGLLARPLNSKARGATGSFKLIPKHKKKPQPSKKHPQTGPSNCSKKGTAEPGQQRVPPRLAKTLEKTPQGDCKAKGTRPQQGVAREGPPKASWFLLQCLPAGQEVKGLGQPGQEMRSRGPWGNCRVARKASLFPARLGNKPNSQKASNQGCLRAWTQKHRCSQSQHSSQVWEAQAGDTVPSQEGQGPLQAQPTRQGLILLIIIILRAQEIEASGEVGDWTGVFILPKHSSILNK